MEIDWIMQYYNQNSQVLVKISMKTNFNKTLCALSLICKHKKFISETYKS